MRYNLLLLSGLVFFGSMASTVQISMASSSLPSQDAIAQVLNTEADNNDDTMPHRGSGR